MEVKLNGKIDRIGLPDSRLSFTQTTNIQSKSVPAPAVDLRAAALFLIDWLEKETMFDKIHAIGHRIVQGMGIHQTSLIDQHLLDHLKSIQMFDPDHLPGEIELIEAFRKQQPQIPQIACFDSAFHANLPQVAQLLPIPRRFEDEGVRRYGFHGLSYAFLLEELIRIAGPQTANFRIILAHLGNGASITAVRDGKSIDTSMGFTPAGGLPMSTRTGDLDPGVAWYMMQRESLSPAGFNNLVNHQSGLLGISGTGSDMRDLLQKESSDIRASEAIELFCYQVKKWIGAYSAVLGGLDLLVFSGGIGENAPPIRSRICAGLGYLGIELDERQNEQNGVLISTGKNRVPVYVIPTNEERMIAQSVSDFLQG
jgi:acetate kinase